MVSTIQCSHAVENCTAAAVAGITVDGVSVDADAWVFKPARFSKALAVNLTYPVAFEDETGDSWDCFAT